MTGMTTPQRTGPGATPTVFHSMGTPPKTIQEQLEEQRLQLEADRLRVQQQQAHMAQQGNDWMQAKQAEVQAQALEHQRALDAAHQARMEELERQAASFLQMQQQQQQQQQAFSQQVQQQQQLAQAQQEQLQQQQQQLMQQQFQHQHRLQLQAQQGVVLATPSGGSPPSAPTLLHADTFLSADAVPTPGDHSSEKDEYFFRQ